MTVDYFLDATLNNSVTFNAGNGGASISSPSFSTSRTYTVYVYAFGTQIATVPGLTPQNNSNGVPTLSFSSPFNGQTVPAGITVTVEVAH